MRPIWFFVGALLLLVGVIILAAGLANLVWPDAQRTVLAQLHPRIWWGAIMCIAGGLFLAFNRKLVE
jgi:drug/metabolite transporter (DMT)-like permease